ncbi:SAM-dependent methyltransferase [Falsiroseomonas algicola]|nr:methyltransferase domain-containing protein [Falsiroseomonas algicola]
MDGQGRLARLRQAMGWITQQGQEAAQRLRAGGVPPELRHAAWNTKVLGSAFARQLYATGIAGPGVPPQSFPVQVRLTSGLCRQQALEQPWLHYWCSRLGMYPMYHRKVWEDCFVAQALWEAGMLNGRRRALGFAVGREMLPAFFAAFGVEVLATDLGLEAQKAKGWQETGQHASELDHLFWPHLVEREVFDQRVTFQPADMRRIPDALADGSRDFVWSVCSFEHLGSIQAGLDFVVRAMDCLRPGGVAVHTTEFNMAEEGPTVESGNTVLFQRRHIEALGERLAALGHELLPVDYSPGQGVLDMFVDLPPYREEDGAQPVPDTPHLRLAKGEHVVTSIGLIIRKAR